MPTGAEVVRRIRKAFDKHNVPYRVIDGAASRGSGNMREILTITAHHTAGSLRGNAPSRNVVKNGRPGLRNALCNLFLPRDGVWEIMAGRTAWHAGKVRLSSYTNPHNLGIEAENTGLPNDPWPAKQMASYALGCKALAEEFGRPVSRVLGHKEICSPRGRKPDPSFSMPAFRTRVGAARSTSSKPKAPAPVPASPRGLFDMSVIAHGKNTTTREIKPGAEPVRILVGKFFSACSVKTGQTIRPTFRVAFDGLDETEDLEVQAVLVDYVPGGKPQDIIIGAFFPEDLAGRAGRSWVNRVYTPQAYKVTRKPRTGGSIRLQLRVKVRGTNTARIRVTDYTIEGD